MICLCGGNLYSFVCRDICKTVLYRGLRGCCLPDLPPCFPGFGIRMLPLYPGKRHNAGIFYNRSALSCPFFRSHIPCIYSIIAFCIIPVSGGGFFLASVYLALCAANIASYIDKIGSASVAVVRIKAGASATKRAFFNFHCLLFPFFYMLSCIPPCSPHFLLPTLSAVAFPLLPCMQNCSISCWAYLFGVPSRI